MSTCRCASPFDVFLIPATPASSTNVLQCRSSQDSLRSAELPGFICPQHLSNAPVRRTAPHCGCAFDGSRMEIFCSRKVTRQMRTHADAPLVAEGPERTGSCLFLLRAAVSFDIGTQTTCSTHSSQHIHTTGDFCSALTHVSTCVAVASPRSPVPQPPPPPHSLVGKGTAHDLVRVTSRQLR